MLDTMGIGTEGVLKVQPAKKGVVRSQMVGY